MLTSNQGNRLIELARKSIESAFEGEHLKTSDEIRQEFSEKQGVFVTLHKNKNLRGCIGYPMPTLPLYEAIISAARSSAFQDPRFPPLSKSELNYIDIEISVLSVPELIEIQKPSEYFEKINIGEDGLIIKDKEHSGLLLPQVATEYGWSPEEFLMHTCNKAGLNSDAWKEPSIKLYKFQAQVFNEEKTD
ncbi:MAG: AmmeMemoRadiSam system protein A [Candidatus Woesearchaeota archaeon]